jgi:hypothetical protein
VRWRVRPIAGRLRAVPSGVVASACLAGTALIGALDFVTGDEIDIALTLLYLIPISVATWRLGPGLGIVLSFAAAVTSWFDLVAGLGGQTRLHVHALYWNGFFEFAVFLGFTLTLSELKTHLGEERRAKREAEEALAMVKKLTSLLPMCASCKKVRDDAGIWEPFDAYLLHHTDTQVTHGLCPNCLIELYPEQYRRLQEKERAGGGPR